MDKQKIKWIGFRLMQSILCASLLIGMIYEGFPAWMKVFFAFLLGAATFINMYAEYIKEWKANHGFQSKKKLLRDGVLVVVLCSYMVIIAIVHFYN